MWVLSPLDTLWTGSEDAVRAAQELADRINAFDAKDAAGVDIDAAPTLLEKQGNVGVIKIEGQLFAQAPNWAKHIFGITDYVDVNNALIEAAKDASIGAILLDVNSPGGAVSGVDDVAKLVKRIDTELKPVHAIAGGMMASAAYWISSGARHITAGPLSAVGSIGVLQIHREFSKADEKDGITTTVLRAGKYKALGNAVEPLSKEAREEIQSRLDYTYGMFMGHVADARGVPYQTADAKMGQGRVFLGEQAQEVGLIDGIGGYAEALTAAEKVAVKTVDARKSLIHNHKSQKQEGSTHMGKKATLTDADLAALASGVPVDQLPGAKAEDPPTEEPKAEDPPVVEDTPAEEPKAEDPPAEEPKAEVVALLERQLKDAQDALLAARVEATTASNELKSVKAKQDPLVLIARDSVTKMHIALGGNGEHVAALSLDALLEEHAKVSQTFKDRFKVGGVAAASAQAADTKKAPKLSNVEAARIKAARIA